MAKKKTKKVPKVRATKVNEILRAKVGGKHEEKTGPRAKRARQKELARKEIQDI